MDVDEKPTFLAVGGTLLSMLSRSDSMATGSFAESIRETAVQAILIIAAQAEPLNFMI
jgi:hypothetical protein